MCSNFFFATNGRLHMFQLQKNRNASHINLVFNGDEIKSVNQKN